MILYRKIMAYGFRRIFVYCILSMLQFFRINLYRYFFSDNSPHTKEVKFYQPVQFVGKGVIELHGVTIGVWPSPGYLRGHAYFEARSPEASIRVGEGTCFNNGASLIADKSSIVIGCRCLIGFGFSVVDSDFHGLSLKDRLSQSYYYAPVTIGDDVFVGNYVKILKGVKVGDGAVIGAGSLVVSDVASNSIYAGVPAKFIRKI